MIKLIILLVSILYSIILVSSQGNGNTPLTSIMTMAELQAIVKDHNNIKDCQTVLAGNLYDLSTFLTPNNHHPAGSGVIAPCCGQADKCDAQLSIRHPARYVKFLAKYQINPPTINANITKDGNTNINVNNVVAADAPNAIINDANTQPNTNTDQQTTQTQDQQQQTVDPNQPHQPNDPNQQGAAIDPNGPPTIPAIPTGTGVPTGPAATTANIKQILIVDDRNNIVDFDPTQFPDTTNFLPTLQPGVVASGVKSVVFTAKAESQFAKLTIKVNDLPEKPYISNEPIVVDLAEVKVKDTPTAIEIKVVSADANNKKTYNIVIPPDAQQAINTAALCLQTNKCLIMNSQNPDGPNPNVAPETQTAQAASATLTTSSSSSNNNSARHLSLGDSRAFMTLIIVLASCTTFFAIVSIVLWQHQKQTTINTQTK